LSGEGRRQRCRAKLIRDCHSYSIDICAIQPADPPRRRTAGAPCSPLFAHTLAA
jgi:hypothetical protein